MTSSNNSDQIKDAEIEEIQKLIHQTSFPCPTKIDLNSSGSLRELSTSLLETLNERMLQLKHQRSKLLLSDQINNNMHIPYTREKTTFYFLFRFLARDLYKRVVYILI